MNNISIKRFGFAFGMTGTLLYLGCVILMVTVGREGSIQFFNSILHGLDTSLILRTNVPLGEILIGIVETFILSWLIGACIAVFYNITAPKHK